MAARPSTRRNGKTATATSAGGAEGQADAVREVLVQAARIQLASLTASSAFVSGWAQSADRYTRAISDELLDRLQGETASRELIGRVAAVSSKHLCELTALPTAAVSQFNSFAKRARASILTRDQRRGRRSARAGRSRRPGSGPSPSGPR